MIYNRSGYMVFYSIRVERAYVHLQRFSSTYLPDVLPF